MNGFSRRLGGETGVLKPLPPVDINAASPFFPFFKILRSERELRVQCFTEGAHGVYREYRDVQGCPGMFRGNRM